MSPTITTPAMTQAGMILGTAAYMAPEQARGKPVDKRADIWAFGCVLYEMLTGRRAFPGEDVTDTLAAIVRAEPDWTLVPRDLSATLLAFLRRSLQKDPKQRVGDIRDMRFALEGAFETAGPQPAPPTTSPASGARLAWLAFAAALLAIAALAIPAARYLRGTPPPAMSETRVDIVTPATTDPTSFALSPDGQQIVFVASSGDGGSRLWLRSLATTTAQPLAGTEGASSPFWAPDGRSLGFFAAGALKRLDLSGGVPQTLAPSLSGRGGTWNADGVILFSQNIGSPLMRVSATGGSVVAVTTLTRETYHRWPSFLPDGRRFLFYTPGGPDTNGIYLGALDGSAPTRLTPADSAGVYLPSGPGPAEALRGSGWLLWLRAGTLVAQPLDLAQAALTGEPVTLADGVAGDQFLPSAVSVAATGLVAYRTGASSQRELTWFDRSGTARGTVGDPDATLFHPRVSPDGRRVVVGRAVQHNLDLWLLDGARASRVTFDAAFDSYPLWSPDGARIVFSSSRTGPFDLYQKLTSGAGVEERLVASDQIKTPSSWSADGRFLLYQSIDPQTGYDLWVVPMVGDRTASVFLKTPFRETRGVFSPDGRWVAYQSNESGQDEIYVRPFVPPGAANTAAGAAGEHWQVSALGGIHPIWRPDGKELYYLDPAGAIMAALITVSGHTLEPGAPVRLFPTHIYGGGVDTQQGRQYDVAPDGRFLINTVLDKAATAPITLIQNWNPAVKK
jgi:Tol biopolymer transport system component